MGKTEIMRAALWLGAAFNFFAAAVVAFPDSLGRFAGLPPPGSRFYTWMLALLVALFGVVYALLARRPQIDRALIGLAVVGKLCVFALSLICWLIGEIPGRAVAPGIGDLMFGLVFLWWLISSPDERKPAPETSPSRRP